MKKNAVSSFIVFIILIGVASVVNAAPANNPFTVYPAKGGMVNCTQELDTSIKELEVCSVSLDQASANLEACTTGFNQTFADLGICNSELDLADANLEVCNTAYSQISADLGICDTDLNQAVADLETCYTALSACEVNPGSGAESAAYVAATGQTTSYAAGDDGDLQAGVAVPAPRFFDSGDGTVTDYLTGLVWMKNAGIIDSNYWRNAVQACNALAAGYPGLMDGSVAGDWRLPNVRELNSLIDFERYNYALPDGHPFINVRYNNYWTSTTYAGNTNYAFTISPSTSFTGYAGKSSVRNSVLCVRDGF